MTLPYDVARCRGTDHAACSDCRRREPGRAEWQTCIEPPIQDGRCDAYIPPVWPKTAKAVQR